MRAADMRPADMRRPEPTAAACPEANSAAVPAKPATVSAEAVAATAVSAAVSAPVSATTMPAAPVSATTVSATTATGVCFKCDKRHDEEQHRGQASAGRQHQPHGAAGLGAPHRCGRLSLGILPRTKSL
jgi:hypothetical protein